MTAGSTIGKLRTISGGLTLLAVAAVLLPACRVVGADPVDLTVNTSGTLTGTVGGTAIFEVTDTLPAGTGVFKPFLTLQASPLEEGYNTSGDDVLDTKRVPQWNHDIKLGDLQIVEKNGGSYYVFELDANETGQGNINRLLSIDNIRIYTSDTPSQTVENPDLLGDLRFAMNNPLKDPNTGAFIIDNWVKIDSSNSDAPPGSGGQTSGSGSSDMLVYIPTSAFAGASMDDYLYFYNLNGVHYQAEAGTSSDAGFEEWRAWLGPNEVPEVPEGGNTLILLGAVITVLGIFAGRRKVACAA
jgi:hypothetical protein